MYKIAVIGTGYVGLVTAACFAEVGNTVWCVDIDKKKIQNLKKGVLPIYEPGLDKLVIHNFKEGRLIFTTDIAEAVKECLMLFVAVGTPPMDDGSSDLSAVFKVASDIGKTMPDYRIIIDKSTVPVGTADQVKSTVLDELKKRKRNIEFDVVSNPEFLKEGDALNDFQRPDRIIIGCDNPRVGELMRVLYHPFNMASDRIMVMDIKSAEMTKYAANCMLATKISFINEIANLCERLGADIEMVRRGIGSDTRIGPYFIYPGAGYGGSCFPKDVQSLICQGDSKGFDTALLKCVEEVNKRQKKVVFSKIASHFKSVRGKTFAVWGLSFKPGTDDMREAASLVLIDDLTKAGAKVRCFDPVAMETGCAALRDTLGARFKQVSLVDEQYKALKGADALVLMTEWKQFRNPDFNRIMELLKQPVIFDGRNQYFPNILKDMGFAYYGIGRS
ncbi:MAG: UDP-glucose/GDP-mannose dehydrogenase family protein [Candidatus Wallbacteria bacterium]|nr:UDP-glucose/GDP-mannose dehydrogenase family protein [Candidatus Wallbacteria bacterium]